MVCCHAAYCWQIRDAVSVRNAKNSTSTQGVIAAVVYCSGTSFFSSVNRPCLFLAVAQPSQQKNITIMTDKAPAAAETKKQEPVSSLEGEDEFEEFAAEGSYAQNQP